MVVSTDLSDADVDRLFHALADATRRDILRRSVDGELSVSRLAADYPMSFAAVQKHVAVLEQVGLVTKVRRGRELLVRSEPEALRRAREALDQLEEAWRGRIQRMSALLDED
ncbi:ArsR/SmtB family transcription factor [Protaetiibacter mangrovi]|uniref:Metalloregulator ArsR/SmtB family transcription factor n=1 Tax=Protaetiibacter mangrovi TaxID=2970926 RepID=A0ABT1ZI12_9MICO|nr:metalloregulator ArsR/SmtB family transcription factor [Protaetiibacter mangrovi]MCS0500330.1 metalloregulator ArsR/SmtB family transcription factor [Protaetiibacter mangrovi]TPX03897.1 winged helix-turn-helix transcriptional regulator [Schumannella luteola]